MLLPAGIEHTCDRRWLRAVLAAQSLLPVGLRPLVVAALGPCELALAGIVLVGLGLVPFTTIGISALLLAVASLAALYLVFAVHTAVVMRRSPGAPCGCGGGDEPASLPVVVRGLLIGLGSAWCLLQPPPASWAWLALTAMAGALLGAVGWLMPRLARQ